MNKNTAQIKEGLIALTSTDQEIISGTVVPGSVDNDSYTISVLPSEGNTPIEGVMLNVVTANTKGMILFPKDGSDVVIGSIDGPGEWVLLRASEITKALITIENTKYEMDSSQINIQNGSVVFNIGTGSIKMSTASESLFQLLSDLITAITILTVPTPGGPSGVPVNVPTFTSLLTRLSNLLSA